VLSRRFAYVLALVAMTLGQARAEDVERLPNPLRMVDVMVLARTHRAEILAARSRARAAAERPEIVSALEDPMIFPSLDHIPFAGGTPNWSVTIEQQFPFSGIRGHRRSAAEAEARGVSANADRVQLDVELEAASAYLMLREERQMAAILTEQKSLADDVVTASTARYGAAKGAQSEVLRAETEAARLKAEIAAKTAEIDAATAMLNTSIGRVPDAPVPDLADAPSADPPSQEAVVRTALGGRPELRAGRAEIDRARSEISVMDDMYKPMGMVQTGPAFTMFDRYGWMVMVGISIPIWRGKLRAGVNEAKAMSDMAEQDLVAMRRMVTGDAVAARDRVIAARARWLALRDDVVPRAKAALKPALADYSAGQIPLVSVLETATALWSAQMELVTAERELGLAWARLERATAQTGATP
jgi:outer membrane protein TolC